MACLIIRASVFTVVFDGLLFRAPSFLLSLFLFSVPPRTFFHSVYSRQPFPVGLGARGFGGMIRGYDKWGCFPVGVITMGLVALTPFNRSRSSSSFFFF